MKTLRVLIVDDLPQVREGLVTLLKLAGKKYDLAIDVVGEAGTGTEAIRQAQALRPDVILMDLEMPGMDGYEATRRIKAVLPSTRVIILSIHTGEEARQRASTAGADGFVTKGEHYEILLQVMLAEDKTVN